MDLNLNSNYNSSNKFTGIYRGFVVWNDDPKVRGRIKVFVPGVYADRYERMPASLPWARPFSPSFGGGSPNPNNEDKHVLNDEVGWCSVPHAGDMKTGSQVFLFFENGDINFPVYFGVAQSQEGWFSEHPNQHCFRSDNIRVRIDENVHDPRSTCKFDSYNTNNSEVSKKNLERDCLKYGWKFDGDNGNISQLETRLDIEIEASKMNAVNLNIHGNVNLHIDGDWFVEHIGNKYEYQQGDKYIKQDGNTYIEQNGHYRKVLSGNLTMEHNGNTVENQDGDTLNTRTGTYYEQIDNNVTLMYNSNLKQRIDGNEHKIIRNSKITEVGDNYNVDVVKDASVMAGGHMTLNSEAHIDLVMKDNFEVHSKTGNIILKTEGEFELMKDGQVTAAGFNNMGTRGNIQIVSTFGNINMECVKNDNLANFERKMTVIPWNPEFVRKVNETVKGFSTMNAALQGFNFSTDVSGFGDVVKILAKAQELLIYDGLPVFLPTMMILQNPNIVAPNNSSDVSWIQSFRDEASDWKNVKDDVMWKLPGRMMGNINIKTWSGDINIKTESKLGCAGNINIKATESAGTLPGYKIGTINIENNGRERVYPDPRDLFLDSDFQMRQSGVLEMFSHGTNKEKAGSALPAACDGILKGTGYRFVFKATNYNKLYKTQAENIATRGGVVDAKGVDVAKKIADLAKANPPKLGCPKCISDYLMGVPGVQEVYYVNENVLDMRGGVHAFGFQRLNPFDPENPRGVFNISSGDYDKISIGDGHAIGTNFMARDFSGINIGGFTINHNGDFKIKAGKNFYKTVNDDRQRGRATEVYEFIETPIDYNAPKCMGKLLNEMKKLFDGAIAVAMKPTGSDVMLSTEDTPKTAKFRFKNLQVMPTIVWKDGGFYSEHSEKIGDTLLHSTIEDTRTTLDFGFDFERAKDLLVSNNPRKLEANIFEQKKYEMKISRGADTETHEGGETQWFQMRNFDDPGGKMHAEVSANLDYHRFSITDRSGRWHKSHSYNDVGAAWYDDDKFKGDLVKHFPDSEFDITADETSRLWDEIGVVISNHSWSKYGNHIVGGNHPEYSLPTDGCKARFISLTPPPVDTAAELWVNKKGAGVDTKRNRIATANQIDSYTTLICADCGKNNNITDTLTLDALTTITENLYKKSRQNIKFTDVSGDINHVTETYTAAVNTNVLTLNSDHYTLIPDTESVGGTMGKTDILIISAGNLMKRDMKGNTKFFKHEYKKDNPNEVWGVFTNQMELSQTGFPVNFFKLDNGTNYTAEMKPDWPGEPESAHFIENIVSMSNGGVLEPSGIFELHNIELTSNVAGSMFEKNTWHISNGANKFKPMLNTFRVENGVNVPSGYNFVEIENGSSITSGANIVRVDNQGATAGALKVKNMITLNNDNQHTTMTLSDEIIEGDYNQEKPPVIAMYSAGDMHSYVEKTYIVESFTGIRKHVYATFDASDYKLKINQTTLHSKEFIFVSVESTIDAKTLNVITSESSFQSASIKNYADIFEVHAPKLAFLAENLTVDVTTLLAASITKGSITATTLNVDGTNVAIKAKLVDVDKMKANGDFKGSFDGSLNGTAGFGGMAYLVSPLPQQMIPVLGPTGSTADPTQHTPRKATPKIPVENEWPNAVENVKNAKSLESTSLSSVNKVKDFVRKFIDLELSLLDLMLGKKKKK